MREIKTERQEINFEVMHRFKIRGLNYNKRLRDEGERECVRERET